MNKNKAFGGRQTKDCRILIHYKKDIQRGASGFSIGSAALRRGFRILSTGVDRRDGYSTAKVFY